MTPFAFDDTFPSDFSTQSSSRSCGQEMAAAHNLYLRNSLSNPIQPNQATQADSVIEVNEDNYGIQLCIDMPGVNGNDIQVSVEGGVLSLIGTRCIRSIDGRTKKKHKISRRIPVDLSVVDVGKAIANVLNGVLVLYAPKKGKPTIIGAHNSTFPVFHQRPDIELLTEIHDMNETSVEPAMQ